MNLSERPKTTHRGLQMMLVCRWLITPATVVWSTFKRMLVLQIARCTRTKLESLSLDTQGEDLKRTLAVLEKLSYFGNQTDGKPWLALEWNILQVSHNRPYPSVLILFRSVSCHHSDALATTKFFPVLFRLDTPNHCTSQNVVPYHPPTTWNNHSSLPSPFNTPNYIKCTTTELLLMTRAVINIYPPWSSVVQQ